MFLNSVGFHKEFIAGGWTLCWDSTQMRVIRMACKPHPSRKVWGHAPLPENLAALRLILVGFGS